MPFGKAIEADILFLRSTAILHDSRALFVSSDLLKAWRLQVVEWCRNDSFACTEEHGNRIVFHRKSRYSSGIRSFFSQLRWQIFLFRQIRNSRCRIIYACDLDTALVASIAKSSDCRLIFDEYDEFTSRQVWPLFLEIFLNYLQQHVRKASILHIVASDKRNDALGGGALTLENLWFDDFSIDPRFSTVLSKPTATYFGTVQKDRGIESIVSLAHLRPDWNFVVGGKGELSEFLERVSLPNFTFSGAFHAKDIFSLLRNSWINFAMYDPSLRNNIQTASNKLNESCIMRIPIVTNSGVDLGDTVSKHGLGWVVRYEALHLLSNVLDERFQMSPNDLKEVQDNLSNYFSSAKNKQRDQIINLQIKITSVMLGS